MGCQTLSPMPPIEVTPVLSESKINLSYPLNHHSIDSMMLVCSPSQQSAFIMFNSKAGISTLQHSSNLELTKDDLVKNDEFKTQYIKNSIRVKGRAKVFTKADAFINDVLLSNTINTLLVDGEQVTLRVHDNGEYDNFISQCANHPEASPRKRYFNPDDINTQEITSYKNNIGAQIVRMPFPENANTGIKAIYSFCEKTNYNEFGKRNKYVSGVVVEYVDTNTPEGSYVYVKNVGDKDRVHFRTHGYEQDIVSPFQFIVGNGFDKRFAAYQMLDFNNLSPVPFAGDKAQISTRNIDATPYSDVVHSKGFLSKMESSYKECESK